MPQAPHDLIRQVQICTRSAAGLTDYNPSDPTLPALPPLSAAIAASAPSPSKLLRCKNCKGALLRGSDSIICLYCGLAPQNDAVRDPITFTSTVGSRWLLRSLRLDGSEMVDPKDKSEQSQGYNSPKSLIPLSEFLNFKISWPVETEKQQETVFQEKNLEQSEGSLRTGVPPDKFFLNAKKNIVSDVSAEQPFTLNHVGASDDGKNVAAFGHRNLFQDVKSSEAFSGWEADFQSADSEKQSEFRDASIDSKNNVTDPKSFDLSTGLGVNLASHIDSVFGSKDPNDGKREEKNQAVSPAFDDWNSDDVWNNLSSSTSHVSGGVDPPVKITNELEIDHSFDLFQDFQSQTNNADKTDNNKITSDEHKIMDENVFGEWNDFTGSSEMDIFSFDDRSAKSNFGSFSQPDLFSTSTSNNNTLAEVNVLTSETPTSDWLFDSSGPSHEPRQATNNGDSFGNSAEDDVKMLISQMHDLSFMLDSNLSIPSGPDAPNS